MLKKIKFNKVSISILIILTLFIGCDDLTSSKPLTSKDDKRSFIDKRLTGYWSFKANDEITYAIVKYNKEKKILEKVTDSSNKVLIASKINKKTYLSIEKDSGRYSLYRYVFKDNSLVVYYCSSNDIEASKITNRKSTKNLVKILNSCSSNIVAQRYIPCLKNQFSKDKNYVLPIMKYDGEQLKCASKELKKDKKVVLAAVKQNGTALEYADDSLKKDKEIVLAAVKQKRTALKYADDSLKKDKEIVLAAVKQDGLALSYADDSLKKDKDILAALK